MPMELELEIVKDYAGIARIIETHFEGKAPQQKVSSIVVTGSSFSDPGDDWCEYTLVDEEGNVLASRRIQGY